MQKKNYTPSRSNFQTHKLRFSQNGIKLIPTFKSLLFYGIFAFTGTAIFIIGAIQLPSAKEIFGLFIWSAIFGGAGFWGIFKTFNKKYPEIDLINNIFYPEGKLSRCMIHDDSGIPLKQLRKIIIERTYHRGSKSSYYYYTLQLDFDEGGTFYFLGHGAKKLFIRDAEKLSSILNVPITPGEYKEWISPVLERKNSWAMLIFGIIWTLVTLLIIFKSDIIKSDENFPALILAIFPLTGIIMIFSAIFSLLKKNPRK